MDQIVRIFANPYALHLEVMVGIYLILCQGFNLTFGLGKLLNFSHVAIYGIGAYTTALLATKLEMGFATCLLASVVLCGLFSLLLGAISLRLSRDYLAIGTLAFSGVVAALLVNWRALTNGVLGIPGIPRPMILGATIEANDEFVLLVLLLVVFSLSFLAAFFFGPYSRKLRALAEFEESAQALGIKTVFIRNVAFVVGSMMAGLAGALFASYLNYIDPSSFMLSEMIFVLTIVIVGRPGSFFGGIGATVFLVLLPEPLRFLEIDSSILGPMRQLIYALILYAVVIVRRETLFPYRREV